MIQDIKILLQIGRTTYISTFPYMCIYIYIYIYILLQDNKLAQKVESEEYNNFDENVDIIHEIKPTSLLAATMSEVRQGCECCYFNSHIHVFRHFIFKIVKTVA